MTKLVAQSSGVSVGGTGQSVRYMEAPPTASVPTRCIVLSFDLAEQTEEKRPSFADFDHLVAELEGSETSKAQLSEQRRWVAQNFYGDVVTLASLRLNAGMSQRELAEHCGIKQPHMSRYEAGKVEPKITVAASLAAALGVTTDKVIEAWKNSRNNLEAEPSP